MSVFSTPKPVIGDRLIRCGLVAGPLFIGTSLVLAVASPGFSPTRHAISLLLTGNLGWLQLANFVVTGALVVALAVGARSRLRATPGGTWGPLLIGAYGVLLIVAGCATPDPAFGFPPGTPDNATTTMSGPATVHSLAFFGLVTAVVAACFVFARRFRALEVTSWARYCVTTAVCTPVLLIVGIGMSTVGYGGLPLLGVAVITSSWMTAIAARLGKDHR